MEEICIAREEERIESWTTDECKCFQPCSEIVYQTTYSAASWPSENFVNNTECSIVNRNNLTCGEYFRRHTSFVEVFYEQLNFEVLTEVEAYTIFSLLADFGGNIGLWIGFSTITMVEFIELGLELIYYCCNLGGRPLVRRTRSFLSFGRRKFQNKYKRRRDNDDDDENFGEQYEVEDINEGANDEKPPFNKQHSPFNRPHAQQQQLGRTSSVLMDTLTSDSLMGEGSRKSSDEKTSSVKFDEDNIKKTSATSLNAPNLESLRKISNTNNNNNNNSNHNNNDSRSRDQNVNYNQNRLTVRNQPTATGSLASLSSNNRVDSPPANNKHRKHSSTSQQQPNVFNSSSNNNNERRLPNSSSFFTSGGADFQMETYDNDSPKQ